MLSKNFQKDRKGKNSITQRKVIIMPWDFFTAAPNSRRQGAMSSYF